MSGDRPMLIFVSDVHLTDALHGQSVSKADIFERFWVRIQSSRGKRPGELCFVGDLFDIVRSPSWLDADLRPYHDPSDPAVRARIDAIVDATLERESEFFAAIRRRVEAGELEVHYLLGNHDRLLRHTPAARRKIWKAMTGLDEDVEFGAELTFPEHGVLAYHGHVGDVMNESPDGGATIGDAIGSELILRFPHEVQSVLGQRRPELEDIDDVRPIYAVPAWVRQLGLQHDELLRPVAKTWGLLVEEFLDNAFVRDWMRGRHKLFHFDATVKLRLMLELSTKKLIAKGQDRRLTKLYKLFQHAFDGRMAQHGAVELSRKSRRGLHYVVNGHSHFASMVPLGRIGDAPAVYFNTGTWRTLHQIGHDVGGRPSLLPYDAMSYLVFYPDGDRLGRDYEWWSGAMVVRRDEHRE